MFFICAFFVMLLVCNGYIAALYGGHNSFNYFIIRLVIFFCVSGLKLTMIKKKKHEKTTLFLNFSSVSTVTVSWVHSQDIKWVKNQKRQRQNREWKEYMWIKIKNERSFDDYDGFIMIMIVSTYNRAKRWLLRQLQLIRFKKTNNLRNNDDVPLPM